MKSGDAMSGPKSQMDTRNSYYVVKYVKTETAPRQLKKLRAMRTDDQLWILDFRIISYFAD